ncbi:hypothetical protein ACCO45_014008 [Purpureocillium lilacinum]|uniref:Uncharacterized protein n=1 Tax=Purpureocillium lilacinum TaxID=33203 RepID=A0ACC4D7G9_PURLI
MHLSLSSALPSNVHVPTQTIPDQVSGRNGILNAIVTLASHLNDSVEPIKRQGFERQTPSACDAGFGSLSSPASRAAPPSSLSGSPLSSACIAFSASAISRSARRLFISTINVSITSV